MEKQIDMTFEIDGNKCGSGTLFIKAGKLNIEDAQDEFFKTLRKAEKWLVEEAEEEFKSRVVDGLTDAQEEILKEEHARHYHGTDDDMPDDFESFLDEITYRELVDLLKLEY